MRSIRCMCIASSLVVALAHASASSYDVIIIGSGPGGLLAAEMLTRSTDLSVLMLEAGTVSLQASGGTAVPSYATKQGWTEFDIPGEFDSVAYNKANDAYRIDWIDTPYMWLGKLLGGCSSINAAMYFRTPDAYVDKASWPFSATDVAKGFDEIEKLFHYTETPSTDGKAYLQEAYRIVQTALESAGYSAAKQSLNDADARNNKSKSFGHPPYAIHDGLRDAPAKTVFPLLMSRTTFTLRTQAHVQYIQQSKGTATGVVYTSSDGNTQTESLTSRGVVVVAAGALNTPAVLMQSGIGPKSQLEVLAKHGGFAGVASDASTWVVNDNVGQHVFDTTVVYASLSHPDMKPFLSKTHPSDAIAQYVADRSGPWATPGPVLISYENTKRGDREYELQTTVLPHGFGEFYETNNAYSLGLFLNNPKSRDSITFSETGKLQVSTAKSWYGSDGDDVDVLSWYAAKTIETLTTHGSVFLEAKASETMAQWVKRKLGSVTHHFGGSCFSAPSTVATRCADETFKVIGTMNVYVADASLMKEGTVNPYGFVMYVGHQAGKNILATAFANDASAANSTTSDDGTDAKNSTHSQTTETSTPTTSQSSSPSLVFSTSAVVAAVLTWLW